MTHSLVTARRRQGSRGLVAFAAGAVAAAGLVAGSGPAAAAPTTLTFSTPGEFPNALTVPDDVCELEVVVSGAEGGDDDLFGDPASLGGPGGRVSAVVAVVPGQVVGVIVGAQGSDGEQSVGGGAAGGAGGAPGGGAGGSGDEGGGGGGGGLSSLSVAGSVVIVAGGGGGAAGFGLADVTGGAGGEDGTDGSGGAPDGGGGQAGGNGGAGGTGDVTGSPGGVGSGGTGASTTIGIGGGGGGGAGVVGGGGGGAASGFGGGGGGGSSSGPAGAVFATGAQQGNGRVEITYDPEAGTCPNDPPMALDDASSTPEDTPLVVAAPGVLANDSDVDGDPLTATLVSEPANGTLILNADGSFTYTPSAGFNGTDSFTYQADDGPELSSVATVTITVEPVNDAPVAVDDAFSTPEDVPLVVPGAGVVANDSDADGDLLTATVVSGPAHGSVVLGSLVYTPAPNFFGLDDFVYQTSDPSGAVATATVSINVTPVNDLPDARNDHAKTFGAPLHIDVLANDSDPEGHLIAITAFTGASHGTATCTNRGCRYVPPAGVVGQVRFEYTITDFGGLTDTATVTVEIGRRSRQLARTGGGGDNVLALVGIVSVGTGWLLSRVRYRRRVRLNP